MIFSTVEIDNFLSYEHLVFDLNKPGLTLLVGNNGAGKSTVFDALVWCLFGFTLKGLTGDEVVNLKAKKDCCVSVTLEIETNVISVKRYRKHKEGKNGLFLYVNGEDITGWDIKSTQEKLESLLKLDKTLFTNSVVFAQGFSKFFASLTDKEQKELIEGFIDSGVYEQAGVVAKEDYQQVVSDLYDVERTISRTTDHIEKLEADLEVMKGKHANFEATREEKIAALKQDLGGGLKRYKDLQKKLESWREELGDVSETLNKLKEEAAEFGEVCESCGQTKPWPKQDQLRQAKRDLDDADRVVYNVTLELKSAKAANDRLLSDITELTESENVYYDLLKSTTRKVRSAKLELKDQNKEAYLLSLRKEVCSFWVEAFGLKGIRSFLFDSIVPEFNEVVEHYTQVMTDGQIHVRLHSTSQLKSGETRDKFAVNIINVAGGNSHKASSAGERRSIDLCVLWTLQEMTRRKLQSAVNFELYDEVLDTLSDNNIDNVLSVLRKHAKTRSVFVISHNDSLKAEFDNVYRVTKVKGASQLSANS